MYGIRSIWAPRCSVVLIVLIAIACAPAVVNAQQVPPRIFYSDLQSGPDKGGQNNLGVFITIYGKGFGAAQGGSTMSVGGVAVAKYLQWSDTKIIFQPGSAAVSGNIVVNVGGVVSNGVPFTVRPGQIYFVSMNGKDSQRGTYVKPWQTVVKAKNTMAPGDITYVMDGVVQGSADNGSNAALSITSAGSTGYPKAIIAYPGATVTIGSATGPTYGVAANSGANLGQWVFAGLTLRGAAEAAEVDDSSDWRLVGNDISCPNGFGTGACVNAVNSSRMQLLGNTIHDTGSGSGSTAASYAGIAFSGANTVEVGWNNIANNGGCQGVLFASSTNNQYGLTVHDNVVHDVPCDGISLQDTDPAAGQVKAYNNVVYRAGTGALAGACINIGGSGSGTAQVLNNTFYDCGAGASGSGSAGVLAASTPVSVVNNILYVTAGGESYVTANTNTSLLSGSNNLFYGATSSPAALANSVNADPLFVDLASFDLHLQAASPAIDAGMNSGVTTDYDGVPRPQYNAYDIGAFEYANSGPLPSGQLSQSPSALNFGTVTVGSSSTQSVSVSNTGTGSVSITQMNVSGAGFTASMALPMTLDPGQSTSYAVTFAPQSTGSVTGSVTLVTSGTTGLSAPSTTSTEPLSGTGGAVAGQLTASPASLNFGTVTVGSSGTQTVTVTAATASVTISAANVTGAGFSVSGLTLPTTLAAGQSASFTVTFAPAVAGTVSGSVSLASNASNTPTNIALSGTGATAVVPHSVTLSWSPSTSTNVVGYYVYRGTQSGGPYTKITSTALAGTSYLDTNVTAGTTYYYVVTAVDGTGLESAYSQQATAIIPTP